MARKKKRSKKAYWICLLLYALILIAGAAFVLKVVWDSAAIHEQSQPVRVIEDYVAELNRTGWVDGASEAIAAMPHEVQTDEECAECVREMIRQGVSYTRTASGSTDKIAYNLVCSNGNVIGTVTLCEDLEKAEELRLTGLKLKVRDILEKVMSKIGMSFNDTPWKIESEKFDFNGLYTTMETVIPRMYSVSLNGTVLDSKYIVEEGIPYDVLDPYYALFGNLPTKVRYRFENIIGTLEPVILDEYGEEFVIDPEQSDVQFIRPVQENIVGRLSNFSVRFADRYLKYVSGSGDAMTNYTDLMAYIIPESPFDIFLKNMMDGLSYGHTESYRMDTAVLNGALDLGDGYYLCDISTTYTTFYPGRGEESGASNMKVIVFDNAGDIRAISQELY